MEPRKIIVSLFFGIFKLFLIFAILVLFDKGPHYIIKEANSYESVVYIDASTGKYMDFVNRTLIPYCVDGNLYFIIPPNERELYTVQNKLYLIEDVGLEFPSEYFAKLYENGAFSATVPISNDSNKVFILNQERKVYDYSLIESLYEYYTSAWSGRCKCGTIAIIKYFISPHGLDYIVGGAFGFVVLEGLLPLALLVIIKIICTALHTGRRVLLLVSLEKRKICKSKQRVCKKDNKT